MVYFDNAATTPVPKAVADAMYDGERQLGHTGRPVAEPAQGQTHHHHRRGAQRRSGALQAAGPAGV